MPSHYSVIQYVPDPRSDERVNLGVVVTDGDVVRSQYVDDPRRAATFAEVQVASLREVLRDVEETFRDITLDDLAGIAASWNHSVRVTTPRASLLAVDEALRDLAEIMLRVRPTQRRQNTKTQLLARARLAVERAVSLVGVAGAKVDTRVDVQGKLARHEVDLAIVNGQVRYAMQAISFSRPPSPAVEKDIDATAWILSDVAERQNRPSLAVLLGVPAETSRPDFQAAQNLFRKMDAEVILASAVDEWAGRVARDFAEH